MGVEQPGGRRRTRADSASGRHGGVDIVDGRARQSDAQCVGNSQQNFVSVVADAKTGFHLCIYAT